MTRRLAVLVALAALAVLGNGYWVSMSRPTALADARIERLACVSYAPYRLPGETPFDARFTFPAARIDNDLELLSRRFGCVRTYSVSAGLDQVPALARKHGMTVLLGIWLSRSPLDNERELVRGIDLAQQNRDVVRALIVGNEVLLRGELPEETIAAHMERVRAATGLPVSYADVWEFWLKYPKVARAASFVTIHILPYWEDEPVSVEQAVDHVKGILQSMQQAFPQRDILIGETGWPSEGRQRRGAIPSRVNQARFIREFLNWAESAGVRYNLIEAFDQPWKRQLEGTVGGYWGLYDDALEEKFPLQGPVTEEPMWFDGVLAGLGAAFAVLVAGAVLTRPGAWGLAVLALAGDGAGTMLWAEWRQLGFSNRDPAEWLLTGTLLLLALATAVLLSFALARFADRRADPVVPLCLAHCWPVRNVSASVLGALHFLWLFALAVVNLLLVFDARYRDFPLLLFVAPLAGYLLHALACGWRTLASRPRAAIEERVLAWWALASGAIIVIMERPGNESADRWVVLGALFGVSVLCRGRRGPRRAHA